MGQQCEKWCLPILDCRALWGEQIMHILLFGKNGQVGWELQRALAPLGRITALNVTASDYCGDFSNPAGITDTVRLLKPDVIVNAAAHTAVDKAESEREFTELLNTRSVEAIAKEAQKLGAWLVHYSTDYVFDGSGEQPWRENDIPAPINVYGETKLAGEIAVQAHCKKHLIFRTSWVYAARGTNFAKTMLKLGKERETLSIINDQFGAPTGAELLADCTAHAIRVAQQKPEVAGLYHLVASGETTWFNYAQHVFEQARCASVELAIREIKPVSTSAFPTPAQRPYNSRLNTDKFQLTFDLILPDWKAGVDRMLTEILGQ
ncbi:dTDP-4-dehydrorhamnose reductase [Photorhabdus caribbeanensis]|nr:dTDP-4-dehydrorhamnose reductase [Photorhabdus caribbeanensis]